MTFRLSFLPFLLCLALISCGKEKEHRDIAPSLGKKEVFYVKGELSALYEGATINPRSFFTLKNKSKFNDFVLVGFKIFSKLGVKEVKPDNYDKMSEEEKRKLREKDAGNHAEVHEDIGDHSQQVFSFSSWGDDWAYGDSKGEMKIVFEQRGKRLLPYEVIRNDRGRKTVAEIEPIHYSLNPQKTKFSILAKVFYNDVEYLGVYKFSQKAIRPLVTSSLKSKKFHYPLGPTKRAVLRKGSTISLCGVKIDWIQEEMEKAFRAWEKVLPRDYVSLEVLKKYPPFSDVNTKCVYLIKDFSFSDPHGENVIAGFVLPNYNIKGREIIDADMIIGFNEWQMMFKARGYGDLRDIKPEKEKQAKRDFYMTVLHEFGHIFGLAHAFKENSIMSYRSDREAKLTPYDIKATRNLYAPFYE